MSENDPLRELQQAMKVEEAESAKPLQSRRTNSPAEAKREMERARNEIETTLLRMKGAANERVEEVRRRLDLPERLRDAVRSDPWRLLGMAAAAGAAIGLSTAAGKRGYDTLTKDEIDEIRTWRKERRRHLKRLEALMERSTATSSGASLRQRIRARLQAGRDDD